MNLETDVRGWLKGLAAKLIEAVTDASGEDVREGIVMTVGPMPYRRLDCDGRALAYIRARPKKRVVRVDVTGLWKVPRGSRLYVPNAGGAATLMLRSEADVPEAARFLLETVRKTRDARTRTLRSAG